MSFLKILLVKIKGFFQYYFVLCCFCLSAWPLLAQRQLIYVQPEFLPSGYSWAFREKPFTDIVWVGYRFNERGELYYPNASLLERFLQQRTEKQYLLLALKTTASGIRILTDSQIAERSRQSVKKLVSRYPQISGLQFDFEYLPSQLANNYTVYIQQMRNIIYRKISLQVAVFPPVDFPKKWSSFHDLQALARESDGLIVMLYDRHRPGTEPGCVTPLSWLKRNVEVLRELPHDKIWLGAPLYGYIFGPKKTRAVSRSSFFYDHTVYKYEDGCWFKELADKSQVWYPHEQLYEAYTTAYKNYGFAGLAFWRAGWER